MKALILAAGYAVRLYPLTLNAPKPLLKVGGKAIIDRIIAGISVVRALDEIYVVTNQRFYQNFAGWLKAGGHKKKISLVDDGTSANETRLGAIRDMELAVREKAIDDDLLVVAGDNLFELDVRSFMDFVSARKDGVSVALYDVGNLEAAKRYGVVSVDKSGRVTEFEEKPPAPKSTLVSTGIYYFPKDKIDMLKEYAKSQERLDAPGYYISWLAKNHEVYGCPFTEDWCDIGNIESYKKADAEYKNKEKKI